MHLATNIIFSAAIGAIFGTIIGGGFEDRYRTNLPEHTPLIVGIATSCLLYFSCGLLAEKILPQGAKWTLLKEAGQALIQLVSGVAFSIIELFVMIGVTEHLFELKIRN